MALESEAGDRRDRAGMQGPEPPPAPGAVVRLGLPAALVALAFVRFLPYRSFEPDDLYIYLQFVKNLLERGELAFNAGDPTYGFTSPLWLAILSAATALGRDPFLAAKVVSVAAALATPVLVYLLALRLTAPRPVAFLAGAVWAWNAWLVRWSFSGLEGALSAAMLLSAVLLALRAREGRRLPWGAAFCAGAAPLVRPEMIGFFLLFVAHDALTARGSVGARLRRAAAMASPGVILSGGFGLFALARFGRLLPNTAQAKGALLPAMAGFLPAAARILQVIASTSAVELACCLAGAWFLLRREGWRRLVSERDPRAAGLMAAWSVGLVALYSARGVTVYTRYLLMLLPFVVLAGFCSLAVLWRGGGRRRGAVLLLAGFVLGQNLLLDWRVIAPATRNYERSERAVNVGLGEWLRDRTPPDTVVAALDIGAIGYVSGRRIVDLNGLITPEVIPFKRDGRVNDYLAQHPPDYIVDVSVDPRHLLSDGPRLRLRLLQSRPFDNMFLFQKEPLYYSLYAVDPDNGETVPLTETRTGA